MTSNPAPDQLPGLTVGAVMDPITEILLPKLEGVRQYGGYWKAPLPGARGPRPEHDRRAAALRSRSSSDCHAGCDSVDILAKVGLTWTDLCGPRDESRSALRGEWTPHGEAVAVYDYTDEDGIAMLYQVYFALATSSSPSAFPTRAAKTGWRWNSSAAPRRVLYRLPKLVEAVDRLRDHLHLRRREGRAGPRARRRHRDVQPRRGYSKGWRPEYAEFLRDAIVIITADRDKPGQAHARQAVATSAAGHRRSHRDCRSRWRGAREDVKLKIKDVSDHLAAGHSIRDLVLTWSSGEAAPVDLAPDLHEFLNGTDPPYDWIVESILERGDRLVWTGFEGLGKALALDTPIPTPKGWTTPGELSTGDEVFGADGTATAGRRMATPVMTGHDCYRVAFSDGARDHRGRRSPVAHRDAGRPRSSSEVRAQDRRAAEEARD